MNRKQKTILLLSGIVIILCVIFLYNKNQKSPFGNPAPQTASDPYRLEDPSLQIPENSSLLEGSQYPNSDFDVDIEQVIEDYSEWSKYPPNSRPLRLSHVDVLNPRIIPVSIQEMPMIQKGEIKNSGYSCHLQPEYHTVTESMLLNIFLSCYQSNTDRKQKLIIDNTKIEGRAGKNLFYPPNISGNDAGFEGDKIANDLRYTFQFRPRLSDWGDMNLTVQFFIVGDPNKIKYTLTHHFFSSPIAPAIFTGKFLDRIDEGSLFVDVEVQVKEPGIYTIEANLMSESEEPIGYSRSDKKLTGGKQMISLQFFGKIIASSRESGPYIVTNVRGSLNTDVIQEDLLTKSPAEVDRILSKISDDRPKHKTIPYFEGTYATAAYSLGEFSDKDYDSPEKRQRLADLKMLRK